MKQIVTRLKVLAAVLALVLIVSTMGFSYLEGMDTIDALYFSVVTVATVGYGDLHPVTPLGKLLAVMVIITGVGTFLGVIANGTELLMERKQERDRQERLNMVVGLFFSEIGFTLLRYLSSADPGCEKLKNFFDITPEWEDGDFKKAVAMVSKQTLKLDPGRIDHAGVSDFLKQRSDLLLRLLENPNLAEHEKFTGLLRAVFHLKSELRCRSNFSAIPDSDIRHLAGDAERVYLPLTLAWLEHMRYLKDNYPFLYSLAVRTNPYKDATEPLVL